MLMGYDFANFDKYMYNSHFIYQRYFIVTYLNKISLDSH